MAGTITREAPSGATATPIHLHERIAAFVGRTNDCAARIGIRPPAVHDRPTRDGDILDGMVEAAYRRPFLAFTVRARGQDRIYVDPRTLAALTDPALHALAAHEVGHAGDWCMHVQHALGGLMPERLHRALESAASPRREAFADRVCIELAGAEAFRTLHREAARAMGFPEPPGSPPLPMPGLPPSLRLALGLRPRRRRPSQPSP